MVSDRETESFCIGIESPKYFTRLLFESAFLSLSVISVIFAIVMDETIKTKNKKIVEQILSMKFNIEEEKNTHVVVVVYTLYLYE